MTSSRLLYLAQREYCSVSDGINERDGDKIIDNNNNYKDK